MAELWQYIIHHTVMSHTPHYSILVPPSPIEIPFLPCTHCKYMLQLVSWEDFRPRGFEEVEAQRGWPVSGA